MASREDWYRRTSWTRQDEEEFRARLKRSRGAFHKVQYLRIQASALHGARLHVEALGLVDEALAYPDEQWQRASLLLLRAECLASLGRINEASDAFRSALTAQIAYPNVQQLIALPWFETMWDDATEDLRAELIDAVAAELERWSRAELLPIAAYRFSMAWIAINEAYGSASDVAMWAERALDAARRTHSGLWKHPRWGLVPMLDEATEIRLRRLAAAH